MDGDVDPDDLQAESSAGIELDVMIPRPFHGTNVSTSNTRDPRLSLVFYSCQPTLLLLGYPNQTAAKRLGEHSSL